MKTFTISAIITFGSELEIEANTGEGAIEKVTEELLENIAFDITERTKDGLEAEDLNIVIL